MMGFNAEKATALGIRGLALMGRKRKRKGGEKKMGKVKLRSCLEEQEPKPGPSLAHSSQLSGPGSECFLP